MDLSSLPEDQRQQLQHLQQLFQEHQLQRQQQQQIQEHASQAYDPAQVQEYNQSYYAYYQYQDPQQSLQYSHNPQQQQQDYAYYHPDYGNAYQQQAQHHQNLQPEGQPAPQMAEASGALGQGQNGYLPLQLGGQNPAYSVPPGLNPAAAAAVAALSQLTQFAGTMEAAERALAMVGLGGGVRGGQFTAQGPTHHGQELFDLRVRLTSQRRASLHAPRASGFRTFCASLHLAPFRTMVASHESNGAFLSNLGFAHETHHGLSSPQLNEQYSSSSSSSYQLGDTSWCVDSGATNHITSSLQNLSLHSLYGGSDKVAVGNGQGLGQGATSRSS